MKMNIKEWAVHHIKQKDQVKRDLVSFKEEEDKVICEYKQGAVVYYCKENLELDKLKKVAEAESAVFVCECNEHNFKVLLDNWDLFKTRKEFTFIFLNPSLAEKWVIKPYIHAKIADPASLKQGLRTMYDTCMGNSKE
jgi:hypothetical protein